MRVEIPFSPQSSIEAPKNIEKKDLTESDSTLPNEEKSFIASPPGSSGIYSLSSLRAAVDHYAKFLTVAESNLEAVNHPPRIPQALLARLNVK